jgi:PAS domain S-box-containing protein
MNFSNDIEEMVEKSDHPEKENGFHSVLLELRKIDKTDLHDFLRKVLDVVSNTLNIERVSIWFFNEDKRSIYCDYLYLKRFGEYASETALRVEDYPEYFNTIKTELVLAANDALNDPRTAELAETYLKPRGVLSMMDVPIYFHGETIGIICHEEQDNFREWKRTEMDFAAAISSLLSTSLEIDFRKDKEKQFNESQRFLSNLISNLPGYVYRVNKTGDNWNIQYISSGVYELTGYKPDELINNIVYYAGMVNEADKQKVREVISTSLTSKKPYQINYRINTAENKLKWVWEQGCGIYDTDGMLTATEGFITDITEKKLFEEELVKKNYELSVLYEYGKSLSKLAEPPEIVESAGNILGRLFKTDSYYIALKNEEKDAITFPYLSIHGKRTNTEDVKLGNGINEFVMNSRRPMLINNHSLETLKAFGISVEGILPQSLLVAPMIAAEKVIGTIALQDFKNTESFTDSHMELLATVASQTAIALENAELYHTVRNSLKEKEVLLKEVHHRVKNNLQIMSSLVKLQTRFIKDDKMLEIMKDTGGRIQSMSIVHTKLYNSGEYEFINFAEYAKSLSENFLNTFGSAMRNISFKIDMDNIKLNIDTAIPCGLIINELVTNSIKHAFTPGRGKPGRGKPGIITISLISAGKDVYVLTVSDNGKGSETDLNPDKSETLGLQLVSLLSKQLNGKMTFTSQKDMGVFYSLKFEESEYKTRK